MVSRVFDLALTSAVAANGFQFVSASSFLSKPIGNFKMFNIVVCFDMLVYIYITFAMPFIIVTIYFSSQQ